MDVPYERGDDMPAPNGKYATRFPWLTIGVFAVTAAVSITQLTRSPWLLARLERTPAGLHGQLWRTATSLVVQDGGLIGTASNLFFLLVLGIAAERSVSRGRWLLGYLGAGLAGEIAGYAWQPTGGGNSVAVCGLAGIVAIALCHRGRSVPSFGGPATLLWCGCLLATWYVPLLAIGVVAAGLSIRLVRARSTGIGAIVVACCLATAAVLIWQRNIHGAALAAALVLGLP
jgi:membrane associated rhomboid family serine protease